MVSRRTGKGRKKKPQIIAYTAVVILAFLFLYPFWQTLVISFSDKIYANEPGFKFWPRYFSLDAYRRVFAGNTIYIGYVNTLIRTLAGTALTLIITFMASYAMTHREIPGWSVINIFIVFTMFFGGGLIPTYLNLKSLGLLNTRWVLILPGAAGAWNFLVMRSFLNDVGKELEDSARIDGAGTIRIMVSVIAPLSKAVIAVIGLWSVVGHWNAWYDAQTYANKSNLVVLQTVVRRLIVESEYEVATGDVMSMASSTPQTVRAATVMVATLPILAGYPFIQKYLVKGVMIGSIKG